jgi:large subunit ribosomal protein L31
VKPGIHPVYQEAKVRCACGNEFTVGSTQKEIRLDICSKCHPFFTGKQKFVDTAGRVDKYFRKYGEEAQRKYKKKKKKLNLTEEEIARELEMADNEETAEIEEAPDGEPVEAEPEAEAAAPSEQVVESVPPAAPVATAEQPAEQTAEQAQESQEG